MVQDRQVPLDVFVGRTGELARMAEVLSWAQAGQPWLVNVEGDPGVGKTSLVRRCLAEAPKLRTLTARAAQAETDLAFGLVEQLLRSAGDLSRPAFPASGDGSPQSSFTAGAYLLEVIGELSSREPVAIVIDDLQWADHPSVAALTFMMRRLSVDPVITIVTHRGDSDHLDDAAQRLLASVENRLRIPLGGIAQQEVAELAGTLMGPLAAEAAQRLHAATGGHPLYLRSVLSEGSGFDPRHPERLTLPRSLAASIGGQLRTLPPETRGILEMLAVLNQRLPLAQLGQAAQASSPSAAIEPAVIAGLVDWQPDEPSCPVALRHLLIRDAIYASIALTRRRTLHQRAAQQVSESASWEHRVAALEQPDEDLAAELEQLAATEADRGQVALAATHLQWASDISPDRTDRERRLLTAVLRLMMTAESRGMALRPAVEAADPSPLRGLLLGRMAAALGQFTEAERHLTEALTQAQADPASGPLAALIAGTLGGTYLLMGDGDQGLATARWALGTGRLDPLAASRTRTQVAIGALEVGGPTAALAELGQLDADPARVRPLDAERLAFRGLVWLLAGDLSQATADATTGLAMARAGAPLTLGLQPYGYLALTQYLAGRWDDALLTCDQASSVAVLRARRSQLPLLHLAAACVPAGRGQAEEAGRHAALAGEIAASLDYAHEALYAAMARALIAQAAGDHLGMANALRAYGDEAALDARSRALAALWRPLLAEGLIGSGETEQAVTVLGQLGGNAGQARWLQPAVAWLAGWLAEQQGDTGQADEIYASGESAADAQSPVYTARLLLAHGRLLRRTGQRRPAIERLRQASTIYQSLRAAPFLAQTEQELAACHLPASRRPARSAADQPGLALTSRETEVAHLVGKGMSNPEIASELFISRKAVEYHLGNIYAKCGVHGRQELRRFVERWRQPVTA
jgi:DNA-binding CsgD family transcriptional regulator